jgi:hypothetical protein
MLLKIINSFGFNLTSGSRVKFNITNQFNQLVSLFGNQSIDLKNLENQLLNIPAIVTLPKINISIANLTGN